MGVGRAGQRADDLINELGITAPNEIDIEAIAFDRGVNVSYEVLHGCEATLVGYGDKAIATINPSPSRGRERFSIGHEIGHWQMHRGKSFKCRSDDIVLNYSSNNDYEKEADEFAAHLLMPTKIFQSAIRTSGQPGLNDLKKIADDFEVSLQAISIRLTQLDSLPVIVACYSKRGREWYSRANHIPRRWMPKTTLDRDSFAYDVLHNGQTHTRPRKQPADAWFEQDDADQYELLEQAIPSSNSQVLVMLYLSDSEMFEETYTKSSRSRY